jgi:hypothetical protein
MKHFTYDFGTTKIRWRAMIGSAIAISLLLLATENAFADPPGYMLPWTAPATYVVTQGWNSAPPTLATVTTLTISVYQVAL